MRIHELKAAINKVVERLASLTALLVSTGLSDNEWKEYHDLQNEFASLTDRLERRYRKEK